MDSKGKIRATLKITPDEDKFAVPRPSAQQMDKAESALRGLGFDVLRRSKFGVEVEGTSDQYRKHLNVAVPSGDDGLVKSVKTSDSGLADLVDSIEIVPPAELV